MRLFLGDMLALAGRLSDEPGSDTARERFRRFLLSYSGRVEDLCELLDDGQRAPDDQSQRALMDVVVALGRYLGFDTTYGTYERLHGAVRFDGAWRSPGRARFVLEVRTDLARLFTPDDLQRAIAALPPVEPPVDGERTLGLCVVVPMHGTRRRTDAPRKPAAHADIRVMPLRTLVALANAVGDQQMTHEQVLDVILDAESDERTALVAQTASVELQRAKATPAPSSHLTLVPKEAPPDYWIATIIPDEDTSSDQFVDVVIRGRQVLGVSAIGIFPASARPGDWVCFFVNGVGVVGSAQLAGELERIAAPLRNAWRFAAVFTLAHMEMYDVPNPLDPSSPAQRLAHRVPFETPGPFLSPISQRDFAALTARASHRSVDRSSSPS